ncbi:MULTISPECIES: hypothetical protein [Rhodopseudomonas]|uniref:Uncharacterized protein n=1 Tax=Rhodopseudomonas palustris TaxID=1076 RepID=A0A0D7EJM5_RHOPL|nr:MULTISPECIES: hypothetical protein [Rhodopseudomonas]KIZ40998.1 hypothetical protein OO17_16170 [Rhodopseudomonas palustris]MDF3813464.1 hypothetical protein [Rhodopseudomonas sp. BAL398]WOK18709.1 hypothetical protein RBJ75_04050 [Rhodopseudomonas sp. BAL398]
MTQIPPQADTFEAPLEEIVWNAAFRRGFAEVRAGRFPRFDDEIAFQDGLAFVYEWGRQFAILAPPDLPLVLPDEGALNPQAVALFRAFVSQGEICR